ncbi:MAG: hypothetical protein UX26_C0003G0028 [Parcubacteria group bacterium GW2011_GWC1_45_9]|nr:MAG: hypothetical protein UW85_C0005G0026 [Parcubacteria group bacterium GW2011_GWA1_Parcubacteria_45_10]KKT88483.1 MAG: hypothetical protein UW89_C0007G0026 [Parcubacteria group bacterium GW2011_GWB1_45_10]KKU17319.1 MAG: hypothetical protein UX26_C0003G0028 [Parcubacteria group bacterium GW2011_GWC1_45_9]
MNLLAVDFGEKNIGLAFYSPAAKIPLTLEPLRVGSKAEALAKLGELVKEKEVGKVVFGLPLNFEFAETEQSQKTRQFAKELFETHGVEVDFVNEVLSSVLASQLRGSSKDSHSSSALLILEDYLDKLEELGS